MPFKSDWRQATPVHFIDRDTFCFFETDGTAPTFLYTYDKDDKRDIQQDNEMDKNEPDSREDELNEIRESRDEKAEEPELEK